MTPLLWALLAGMLVSLGFIGYWFYRWVQDKMRTEDIPNWLWVCMFCVVIGVIGVNLWALLVPSGPPTYNMPYSVKR